MSLFSKIADGFVQAFGITAPSESQRRTAVIFITALLFGILLAFLAAAGFLAWHFLR